MKLDIRKNYIWGNVYWRKQKFGGIENWKNGFSGNANLEKGKFREKIFGKMQIWKNTNLKIGKFGKLEIRKNGNW